MGSAALLLLASSFGVVFGWQPMQDGSPRYEYIVQLEPELVETLEKGPAIPITTDIPEDVGPIGRIRIVVGRGELPRQQLVTQFKPLPHSTEKQSREGVVETQYTQANPFNRYATSASNTVEILPENSSNNTANAFANELRQGANQAIQKGAQNLQEQVSQILPPPGNSGNAAVNNVGQATLADPRELFGGGGGTERSILPQASTTSASGNDYRGTSQPAMQNTGIMPPNSINDRPVQIQERSTENPQPAPSYAGNSQGNNFTAGNNSPVTNAGQGPTPPNNDLRIPAAPSGGQSGYGTPPSYPQEDYQTRQDPQEYRRGYDKSYPLKTPTNENDNRGNQPPPSRFVNNPQDNFEGPGNSGSPERGFASNRTNTEPEYYQHDRRETNRAIEEASIGGSRHDYRDNQYRTNNENTKQISARPMIEEGASRAQDNQQQQNYANNQQFPGNNQNESTNPFPLILSWVFLSGSVMGNIYMFMSYLDIRGKYRGVVHGDRHRMDERYRD